MQTESTFQDLLQKVRQGDDRAAEQIFARYTQQLMAEAQRKLSQRVQQKVDAEDVVQSVYRSFLRRDAAGQFQFDGAGGLWALLATITARKCQRYNRRYSAQKRDAGRELSFELPAADSAPAWEAAGELPQPEEVAAVVDLAEQLFAGLSDERERQMLELRLQDYTLAEIGERVGRSEYTVRRFLQKVERRLQRLIDGPAED